MRIDEGTDEGIGERIEERGEFDRIASLAAIIGAPSNRVIEGIGDDAAVLAPRRHPLLFCSDAMVEGVHFDLSFASPEDLGHKALASCLSDLAAMNGQPLAALFSIAMPKSLPPAFLDHFYLGATALARQYGVDIVGGDLTGSLTSLFIDAICIGESAKPTLRSGAREGDLIAVSGFPGASAAGLHALRSRIESPSLHAAHLRPQPRFDLLPALFAHDGLCTALIDISDGLSSELAHIAQRSNVGAEIEADSIPLHPEAVALARQTGLHALRWALDGGEDYELLATLDPHLVAQHGIPNGFTRIGRVTSAGSSLTLLEENGRRSALVPGGFDHFSSSAATPSRR